MGKLLGLGIIGIILYYVFQSFINSVVATFYGLTDFLFNTVLGWIALAAGIIAILCIYASTRTYPDIRRKGKIMNSLKPTLYRMEQGLTNASVEIDMTQDVKGFIRNLAVAINQPNPVFFKGWGNHRLELDIERARLLNQYIQTSQDTFKSLLSFRAEIIFSENTLKGLLEKKELQQTKELEALANEFEAKNREFVYKQKMDELTIREKEIELREREANAHEQEMRVEHYKKALEDFKVLPAAMKTYMFAQVFGKVADTRDFDLEEKINEYLKAKYTTEIDKMNIETKKDKEEAKTFVDKMKFERSKYTRNE